MNHLYSTVVYAHLHQIAIKVSDERSKYLYDYEQLQTDTSLWYDVCLITKKYTKEYILIIGFALN